jgi:hypothetical protein
MRGRDELSRYDPTSERDGIAQLSMPTHLAMTDCLIRNAPVVAAGSQRMAPDYFEVGTNAFH